MPLKNQSTKMFVEVWLDFYSRARASVWPQTAPGVVPNPIPCNSSTLSVQFVPSTTCRKPQAGGRKSVCAEILYKSWAENAANGKNAARVYFFIFGNGYLLGALQSDPSVSVCKNFNDDFPG